MEEKISIDKSKNVFNRKTNNRAKIFIVLIVVSLIILLMKNIIFVKLSKIHSMKLKPISINTSISIRLNNTHPILNPTYPINNNASSLYTYNNSVNLVNNKLIWNNQLSLEENKIKKEIKEYKYTNITFTNPNDFIKRENPLITLVITLYNQEEFINRVYYSIQRQEMKDIEIIFVDDASTDNSAKIVAELMEKDKRIIYLKNDVNKRAFYSRNKGILNSKGKYILVIDPDDILINNILIKAYETAEKYNLDIVHFYIMMGYFDNPGVRASLKYKSGILKNNAEVRDLFYFGTSRNICDKLIKREIYLKSIEFMRKEFYDGDYHINDDDTAFFGISRFAESYGFLEQIGYFYIARPPGPNHYSAALNRTNDLFFSVCNIMKYFYFQSDNNTFEKYNVAYKYFQKSFRRFGNRIYYLTKGFDFILDIFNLYLNSSFFDESQKNYIRNYKNKIDGIKNGRKN